MSQLNVSVKMDYIFLLLSIFFIFLSCSDNNTKKITFDKLQAFKIESIELKLGTFALGLKEGCYFTNNDKLNELVNALNKMQLLPNNDIKFEEIGSIDIKLKDGNIIKLFLFRKIKDDLLIIHFGKDYFLGDFKLLDFLKKV